MGKNKDVEQLDALQTFIDQALIDEVLGVVKSGKEATVYLCASSGERPLLAAKVYRSRQVRQFANAAAYDEGRLRQKQRRESRAIMNKSRFGQEAAFGKWVAAEYETLSILHRAGAAVPAPIAMSESIIMMEYLGTEDAPAPMLANVRLEPDEARRVFDALIRNIELMLANDRVHGDLSPYNVLYVGGEVRIIDFPQAIDPRFNANGLSLLERDIENISLHLARHGVRTDPFRIARGLWARFLRSEL